MNSAEYRSEEGLLKLCSAGDERAWAHFVERFAPLIRWAIKDKVSRSFIAVNKDDVDDIFQQTFTHIWRNNCLKNLKKPRSISAWLVIIAQNAAADFIRKKKTSLQFSSSKELRDKILPSVNNPRTKADNNQMYKTVEELINNLPLKERRIMTLELFYDLKHREISSIMDIPINTVSTIIARIKQSFKDKLQKRGYDV